MTRPVGVQFALDGIEVVVRGFDKYGLQKMATLIAYIESLEKAAEWQDIDANTPSGELIIWRSDSRKQEIGCVEQKWVGNPQYAYKLWRPLPTPPEAK